MIHVCICFSPSLPKCFSMNFLTIQLPPPNLPCSCRLSTLTRLRILNPCRLRTLDSATYAICGSNIRSRLTVARPSVIPWDLWNVIAHAGNNGICVRAIVLKGAGSPSSVCWRIGYTTCRTPFSSWTIGSENGAVCRSTQYASWRPSSRSDSGECAKSCFCSVIYRCLDQ